MKKDEMQSWLNFEESIVGNIVDWNNAVITTVNLIEEEVSKEDIMSERVDYQIIILQKENSFANSVEMCKNIGGELAVPNDNVNYSEFTQVNNYQNITLKEM